MSLLLQALQKKDTLIEILSHLTLFEIQECLRSVNQETRSLCDAYKSFVVDWVSSNPEKESREVLITGLTSEKGKLLNGRIGRTTQTKRKYRSGRFPIEVDDGNWISGEIETLSLRLCNLHVFFHQPNAPKLYPTPSSLIEYSSTSMVRKSHAVLLDDVLFFARWFAYEVEGVASIPDFASDFQTMRHYGPEARLAIVEMDSRMFDYWKEKPFRCSRARGKKFGTTLDYIFGLAKFRYKDLDQKTREIVKLDKLWEADGDEGKNMMRNFLHCMKTWKEEHVRGGFWVTNVHKTGTVMVFTK